MHYSISHLSLLTFLFLLSTPTGSQKPTQTCRPFCGNISIAFPFGIDDGCGSNYFRHSFTCTPNRSLLLKTPSSTYTVISITYSDPPHLLLSHPSLSLCTNHLLPPIPFSLQTGTHFFHSPLNTYLFFNCSPSIVLSMPLSFPCETSPDRCSSVCDTSHYFCRNLPRKCHFYDTTSCCSYAPRATESLGIMLQYCSSYTSVHWRRNEASPEYGEVPEYGSIRVDFDIPVTRSCLRCRDGGGVCGFDRGSEAFLCLCGDGKNLTTPCYGRGEDGGDEESNTKRRRQIVEGAGICVSLASCLGIGAGICYLKKVRRKESVVCGVQSTENRLF